MHSKIKNVPPDFQIFLIIIDVVRLVQIKNGKSSGPGSFGLNAYSTLRVQLIIT